MKSKATQLGLTGTSPSAANPQGAIKREAAEQSYLFGGPVGTQDDGKFTRERPLPGTAVHRRHGEVVKYNGAEGSRPDFRSGDHLEIQLATMRDNHAKAMAGLMIPPPDNARQTEKLVDPGLGRLSDGVERPVHTWVDERIKKS